MADFVSIFLFVLIIAIGLFIFLNRSSISGFFKDLGKSANDFVTGTHIVTKDNMTEGQVLDQRVISDVNQTGKPAISGEVEPTLKIFPFEIKNNTDTSPLIQQLNDSANKLGRPLTLDETKAIIAKFNQQQKKDFLNLGGFIQNWIMG